MHIKAFMQRTFFLTIILFCLPLFAQQQITIGADYWIDYTAEDGSGIYFKLFKKIYPDAKIKFKIQPLSKSITDFNAHKLDIIVGVYKYELSQAFFPQWYLDTEYPVLAFYDTKHVQINHLSDLVTLKPAWPDWYKFTKFLPNQQKPLIVKSLSAGFNALKHQQADIFIEYAYKLPTKIGDSITSVEILPAQHVYVAFQHNQFGRKLAQIFDLKMLELRQKGELAQLYGDEYLHSDLDNYVSKRQKITIYTNSVSLLNSNNVEQKKVNAGQKLRFIFNLLNGYQIEFKSFNNIAQMYQQGLADNVCFSDLIKNEKRVNKFYISKPLSLFIGQKLYSEIPLVMKEPINIQHLLKSNNQLRLGTVSGRSYGTKLDNILAQVNSEKLIQSPVDIKTLFKQFNQQRFNLLIEYPLFQQSYALQGLSEKLYSYDIEGADEYILGRMMCTKSSVGKKFIEDFDQLLVSFYHSVYFFNAQYQRVLPENKAKFIQYFNKNFPYH